MNRKTTPDILEALMAKNNTEINVVSQEKIKQENNKEKATFNLSKSVLGSIEDCWIEIRKMRGDKKISKTDIVEQAVADAIHHFVLEKQESQFYRNLVKNIEIKQ